MSRICTISKQKTCLGDRLGHRRSHFPCHRESLTSPSLTTSSWCSHVAWVQSNGAVLDMAPDPPPLHWNSSVAADLQAEQEPELTSYQTAVLWKSQFPNPVSRSIADPTQCIWGWGSWALITPVLHWLLASSISESLWAVAANLSWQKQAPCCSLEGSQPSLDNLSSSSQKMYRISKQSPETVALTEVCTSCLCLLCCRALWDWRDTGFHHATFFERKKK